MQNNQAKPRDYQVEYVRKAVKNLSLRVTAAGTVRMTLPLRMPEHYAAEFLEKKRGWVEKHIELLRSKQTGTAKAYFDGQQLRILDNCYTLKLVQGSKRLVIIDETEITVYCNDKSQTAALLDECLASAAQRLLRELFEHIWSVIGVNFSDTEPSLVIKAAASKWGSYSRRTHRVMLNEKLVRFPKAAAELIIIHELCHIAELNHGQGFYRLLGQILPDWRVRKKLLTRG